MYITKSNVAILHDCPISHIQSDAPQLHGYQTYYTGNNESSGKQVNESKHSMPMMLYFVVCHFSTPDIVFLALPRMPPKGFITSTLLKFIIIGIFGIITTQSCYRMWKHLCVAEIQGLVQRFTDKPIQDSLEITQNIIGCDNDVDQFNHVPHRSCHMGLRDVIQSTEFIFQSILTRKWW